MGLLLQAHNQGQLSEELQAWYDQDKDLIIGGITAPTPVELGMVLQKGHADFTMGTAVRKTLRLVREGELDELLNNTAKERGLSRIRVGADSEPYAQLIGPVFEARGFKNISATDYYLWSKDAS